MDAVNLIPGLSRKSRNPAKQVGERMLNGETVDTDIVRVGSYALIANGEYVNFEPGDEGDMVELARQPSARFVSTAADIQEASANDVVEFGIDPTRGSLLALLIQAATWGDRIGSPFGGISKGECWLPFCDGQGGTVGAIIILGGFIGVLLALERLITLSMVGAKVNAQRKSATPSDDNPLGRVLKVYDENKDVDVETLELKLGEAILGETPKLTRNITLIQVISVVAPLPEHMKESWDTLGWTEDLAADDPFEELQ